jgi:hypothetical protein
MRMALCVGTCCSPIYEGDVMPRLYRALVMGVCAAVFCGASSATAQGQLSAVEVRQIVDNALEVVLPRDTRLSGVSVEQRNIYFDHAKTLDAFV